jgi:hypothetical protein
MIQYKGIERYNAHKQYKDDYDNLVVFYEEWKMYKLGTAQKDKAYNVCVKYLNRIITNLRILGFDYTAEEEILNGLHNVQHPRN